MKCLRVTTICGDTENIYPAESYYKIQEKTWPSFHFTFHMKNQNYHP
jgi:hypothetical protein